MAKIPSPRNVSFAPTRSCCTSRLNDRSAIFPPRRRTRSCDLSSKAKVAHYFYALSYNIYMDLHTLFLQKAGFMLYPIYQKFLLLENMHLNKVGFQIRILPVYILPV